MAVANPIQSGAGQRGDSNLLEQENELVQSSNPISISQKDKAIHLPGPIIYSNSLVVTQDHITTMSPSNVDANGVVAILDLNFERRDKVNFCSELELGVEAYPHKVLLLDSNPNSSSS